VSDAICIQLGDISQEKYNNAFNLYCAFHKGTLTYFKYPRSYTICFALIGDQGLIVGPDEKNILLWLEQMIQIQLDCNWSSWFFDVSAICLIYQNQMGNIRK